MYKVANRAVLRRYGICPPRALRASDRRADRVVLDDKVHLADVEPLLADGGGDEHVVRPRREVLDALALLLLRHPLGGLAFALVLALADEGGRADAVHASAAISANPACGGGPSAPPSEATGLVANAAS